MKPLDRETPHGRQAEADLNAVLAGVARRRERERRQADLAAATATEVPVPTQSPVARPA
jgi:hypothetical protein